MDEILHFLIEQLKEFKMQYGLWETILAYTLMGICFILAWQSPKLLEIVKKWRA